MNATWILLSSICKNTRIYTYSKQSKQMHTVCLMYLHIIAIKRMFSVSNGQLAVLKLFPFKLFITTDCVCCNNRMSTNILSQ